MSRQPGRRVLLVEHVTQSLRSAPMLVACQGPGPGRSTEMPGSYFFLIWAASNVVTWAIISPSLVT
jgi:hypothetical protein